MAPAKTAATKPGRTMSAKTSAVNLVLVDGSGFIFRAFHALPPMNRPDGVMVNAVFGFTNMLARLLSDHSGTHLAVIFDAGRVTFRNDFYPAYKAHRPPPTPELIPQFALVRAATEAFGVPAIELPGFEADDLIASYAAAVVRAGGQATIISSDKDLMQLVGDHVSMLDPLKQKPIGPAEVLEKFGVPPAQVVEVQALMGDSVDNVPGVPGIGPKGAAQLIQEFGNVEAVLAAAPGMKPSKRRDALIEHADKARISRRLVELKLDAPLPLPLESLILRDPDRQKLIGFLGAQGFKSTIQRLGLHEPAALKPAAAAASGGFGPYECVGTIEALAAWVREATLAGRCAVDTETTSLHPISARLIGISLATAPGRACYIPLAHELELGSPPQLSPAQALPILAPLLADPCVLKIFQNAKFDLRVFASAGVSEITPIDDTMLISYVEEAGLHGHGMDELSALHLGHKPISYDEVTGTGKKRIAFAAVALDRATAYAAEDADVTLRLWDILRPRLRETKSLALYETMERRLIPIIAAMERAGIKVDAAELRAAADDFATRMAAQEIEAYRLAGHEFNLGSAKQLGEIMFEEMGIPGGKRGASGTWTTDASVLSDLAEQGHALPAQILAWRQLAKLKSTYTDALIREIDPTTGRVHTSFAMAIAATGRLSSTDPNLQNIPIRSEEGTRIRRAFIAEPGHVLISADYSQIELRLLAHVANIPALRESFIHNEDIHARTASEVFNIPLANIDRETRRRAKAINFGIIYGISAFGLGRQLGISPGEARDTIVRYFERYPEIRAYMDRTKQEAREKGFILTPFGRRVFIPQINDKNGAMRAYAERAAINAPLQGGAADIIKRAMVRLPGALVAAGLKARMILQVHDELLFEAPESEAETAAALARRIMSEAAVISVPLVVETGIGGNWAEAH